MMASTSVAATAEARAGDPDAPIRVAVQQQILAHYRAALFAEMDRSRRVAYTFFASAREFEGIVPLDRGRVRRFEDTPVFIRRRLGLYWQAGAARLGLRRDFDAVIFLGNPYYLAGWIGAALARLRGVPVLFWTHGWLREERGVAALVRTRFYRLADRLLIYNERGKALGEKAGFAPERMTVVYNSLDLDAADAVFERIEAGTLATLRPHALFADPARPLLICTARITRLCRFDLLIEAAARLAAEGLRTNLLLVGEGPERAALEALAKERGVDACFFGACYDDEQLGQLLYHADLTVSPGKIGLTAIHSLMFGTPAITHGNVDEQMPEVETIVPGETGDFFAQGDAADLARAIRRWLGSGRDRASVRACCRALVHEKWSPHRQAAIFEQAVVDLVEVRRRKAQR